MGRILLPMVDDPGILPKIPGEFIAMASRDLPQPQRRAGETAWSSVDTGPVWKLGVVRIRYRCVRMRHGRSTHWAWVAEFAEPSGAPAGVQPEDPPREPRQA